MDRVEGPPVIRGVHLRVYVRLVIRHATNAFNMVADLLELDPPMVARIVYLLAADRTLRHTLPESDDWRLDSSSSLSAKFFSYKPITSTSSFPSGDPSHVEDISCSHPRPTEHVDAVLAKEEADALAESSPGTELAVIQEQPYAPVDRASVYRSQPIWTPRYGRIGIDGPRLDPVPPSELSPVQYLVMAFVFILCISKWVGFRRRRIKYVQIVDNYPEGDIGRSVPDKKQRKAAKKGRIDDAHDVQQIVTVTDTGNINHNPLALPVGSVGQYDVARINQPVAPPLYPQSSTTQHSVLFLEQSNQAFKTDVSDGDAATAVALPLWNTPEFLHPVEDETVSDKLDIIPLSAAVNWMMDAVYKIVYKIVWQAYLVVLFSFKKRNVVPNLLVFVVNTVVHVISRVISAELMLCKRIIMGTIAIISFGVRSVGGLIRRAYVAVENELVHLALRLKDALLWPFRYMRWILLIVMGARRMYLSINERRRYRTLDNWLVVGATGEEPDATAHHQFVEQGLKLLDNVFFSAWDEAKRTRDLAQGNAASPFHLILSSNEFTTLVAVKDPLNKSGEQSGYTGSFIKSDFSLRAIHSLSLSGPAFDVTTCIALFKHTVNLEILRLGNITDLVEVLNAIHMHEVLPNLETLVFIGTDVKIMIPIGFIECRRLIKKLNFHHGRGGLKFVYLSWPDMITTDSRGDMVDRINFEAMDAQYLGTLPTIGSLVDDRLLVPYQLLKARLEPEGGVA